MPAETETLISPADRPHKTRTPKAPVALLARGCAWFTFPWLVASLLFMSKMHWPGFGDPDFYWHLKAGEYIARTGTVPTSDPFSWTFSGKPWVAHEWLTELIFHRVAELGGFTAIALLVAILSVATFAQMVRLASRLSGSKRKGAAIAATCAILLLPFLVPRPQLFTFFFFAVYLDVLLDFKLAGSTRRLWLLPVLMLPWANLHGAFMIGLALMFAFAGLEWIECRIGADPDPARRRNLRLLGAAVMLAVLATLANPQGIRIWLFPFELVSMEASKGGIDEWKSPDFHQAWGKLYLLGICAFFTCAVCTKVRPGLTGIVLATAMLAAGLTSSRHLPLMALLMGALAASYARAVEWPSGITAWLERRRKATVRKKQDVSPAVAGMIHLAALASIGALLQTGIVPATSEPILEKQVPIGAADYVAAHDLEGRMFNSYGLGGYLIYRLAPDRKVFIDGRADMYGDEFLNAYRKTENGQEGWREMFDSHAIDFAVIYRDSPLRQLLLQEGSFMEVYKDQYHAVLQRDPHRQRAATGATHSATKPADDLKSGR